VGRLARAARVMLSPRTAAVLDTRLIAELPDEGVVRLPAREPVAEGWKRHGARTGLGGRAIRRARRAGAYKRGPKSVPRACVGVVWETVVQSSGGQATRDALDRFAGGALRDQLVGEVGRMFPHRSVDDIEEAFNEAYSRALTSCSWRQDREVYGWLRRAMVNWLIDRQRRERRELVVDTMSGAFFDVADAREEPLRLLGRSQERREVRQVHRAVLKQLSDRQRRVVSMRSRTRCWRARAAMTSAAPIAIRWPPTSRTGQGRSAGTPSSANRSTTCRVRRRSTSGRSASTATAARSTRRSRGRIVTENVRIEPDLFPAR
jgi:DNA-directed RNA polymerase specialized sigma24 family protein